MATLPSAVCLSQDGLSVTYPRATKYLGGLSQQVFGEVSATLLVFSKADLDTFLTWYHSTINDGLDAFDITLPASPSNITVSVKFSSDIKYTLSKDIYSFNVTMTLQEDIYLLLLILCYNY